jgi:hypothetical protein
MSFSWLTLIYQVVTIGLILLFIYSLYKFIKGIVQRNKIRIDTLKRLEKKIDTLIDNQNEQRQ